MFSRKHSRCSRKEAREALRTPLSESSSPCHHTSYLRVLPCPPRLQGLFHTRHHPIDVYLLSDRLESRRAQAFRSVIRGFPTRGRLSSEARTTSRRPQPQFRNLSPLGFLGRVLLFIMYLRHLRSLSLSFLISSALHFVVLYYTSALTRQTLSRDVNPLSILSPLARR